MIDLVDLLARMSKAMNETPVGQSQYASEFLREQQVLPGVAGLPRIIRKFVFG